MIGYYGYWVILTYLGVVSAVTGMYLAINGNVEFAVICLMIAGVCDMFDGPVARRAKRDERQKSYGIQIDALADVIGFGVLPAIIGYSLGLDQIWHIIIMSVYVLAALIRLAYFNVTEMELQQKNAKRTYYWGLPVTSVAAIIPLVYFVCVFFDVAQLATVYGAMLVVLSAAFLAKFKMPKIRLRYIAAVCGVLLIPVIIYLILTR